MPRYYKRKDINNILGLKGSCIKEWEKFGVLPTIKANGPGNYNLYTLKDLHKAAYFKGLIEYGISRARAGEIVKHFKVNNTWVVHSIILRDMEEYTNKYISRINQFLHESWINASTS